MKRNDLLRLCKQTVVCHESSLAGEPKYRQELNIVYMCIKLLKYHFNSPHPPMYFDYFFCFVLILQG